jgi:hypothetical protein
VLPNLDVVAVHTRDLRLQSGRDTATDGGIACGRRGSGLSGQLWVEVVQRVKQLGALREQALAQRRLDLGICLGNVRVKVLDVAGDIEDDELLLILARSEQVWAKPGTPVLQSRFVA